jgi:hypothetical protein
MRKNAMRALKGKKTYFTAGLAILSAAAAFATGDATAAQAIQLSFTALLAAFLRDGMR